MFMFIILCSQTLAIIIASLEVIRPVPASIKYLGLFGLILHIILILYWKIGNCAVVH